MNSTAPLHEPAGQPVNSEFLRFLLVGGAAAFVNILSRVFLSLSVPFEAAVVIAYLFGMVTAFCLSRQFVFARSQRHIGNEAIRFVLVNLVALVQVWVVSVGLAVWVLPTIGLVWQADLIAHVIGVLSPTITSYLGHKYITFG